MKKVFISRNLTSKSIFYILLQSKSELIDMSLLLFRPLAFSPDKHTDWLFFYSKNAIKFYFTQVPPLSNSSKIAVMGAPSAHFLKSHYNIQADFVGNGIPDATAERFYKLVDGKRVAFVQARNSRKSVQQLANFNAHDLIVYDNFMKEDFELKDMDILAFTSPMNVQAYFTKYSYQSGQEFLSIGASTKSALESYGIENVRMAAEPSEKALANLCLTLI